VGVAFGCLEKDNVSSNVITFSGRTQARRIYAFVKGKQGHLFVNYWNGAHWHWSDQGAPPGTTVENPPGAITYFEAGKRRIYAFIAGHNGHLCVNYWNGTQWNWADQGTPPGAKVIGLPGVIAYLEGGKQRIYAFVRGTDGQHLYVNYWDGSQWKWADQGTPPGTMQQDPPMEVNPPGVISYLEGGKQRIYAFVRDHNGHLYTNYWDGVQWNWADQGTPPGTSTDGGIYGKYSPAVITY
jgi:hypothetical protein